MVENNDDFGNFPNNPLRITMSNKTLETSNNKTHGVSAWNPKNGEGIYLDLQYINIQTNGEDSNGVHILSHYRSDKPIIGNVNGSNISTNGTHSHGIYTYNRGNGTALLTLKKGNIETNGRSSNALRILCNYPHSPGKTTMEIKEGHLVTHGKYSEAINHLNKGLGDTVTIIDEGTIKTTGNWAKGVSTYIDQTLSHAAAKTIMNNGSVETDGNTSHAISTHNEGEGEALVILKDGAKILTNGANSYGVQVRITNIRSTSDTNINVSDGAIKTNGNRSHGIFSINQSKGGSNINLNKGSFVKTSGQDSNGILNEIRRERSITASNTKIDGGVVMTEGYSANGVHSLNNGTGETIVIIKNGYVETKNDDAKGILSKVINKNSTATSHITINNSYIKTQGEKSHGIMDDNLGQGETVINLKKGGHVETNGKSSNAVYIHSTNRNSTEKKKIHMYKGSSLKTTGDNSKALFNFNQGTGDTATIMDGGTIKNSGSNSTGIFTWIDNLKTNSTANVTMNGGFIEASGNHSHGIFVLHSGKGQANGIMRGGEIKLHGNNAYGIYSEIRNTTSKTNANSTINGGIIETQGESSHGLFSLNQGKGMSNSTINSGKIKIAGPFSYGVYSQVKDQSSTGAANTTMNNGTIETKGTKSHGLFALNQGTGAANILFTGGTIKTINKFSYGLFSKIENKNSDGIVTATVKNGNLHTVGFNSHGIMAANYGHGSAHVCLKKTKIFTHDNDSYGVHTRIGSESSSTEITMDSNTMIETNGQKSHGVFNFNSGLGDSITTLKGGKIQTMGIGAKGIKTWITNHNSKANSKTIISGGAFIESESHGIETFNEGNGPAYSKLTASQILTHGQKAHGVYSRIGSKNTKSNSYSIIDMDSIVNTQGKDSYGIFSLNENHGNANSILNKGTISTQSEGSYGMYSLIIDKISSGNSYTRINKGKIRTRGKDAYGMFSYNRGYGAVEATIKRGKIDTQNKNAYGIYAYISNSNSKGRLNVRMQDLANIKTNGEHAHGILAVHDGIFSVNAKLDDSLIETTGKSAHGIAAQIKNEHSRDNITVNIMNGTISTTGDMADGLNLINHGTGKILLNFVDSRIEGGSGDAAAIRSVTMSGTGLIEIDEETLINGAKSGVAICIKRKDFLTNPTNIKNDNKFVIKSSGTLLGNILFGLGNNNFYLNGGSLTGQIVGIDKMNLNPENVDPKSNIDNLIFSGRDHFYWTKGFLKEGGFFGKIGSDEANIIAKEYDGTQILDGGGSSNDRMMVDVLTIDLRKQEKPIIISEKTILNWERINVIGGKMIYSDKNLNTGVRLGKRLIEGTINKVQLGLHIFQDGVMDWRDSNLEINGDLTLHESSATVVGAGTGIGQYKIIGDVKNDGKITTMDGLVGDKISVIGNYTGTGIIELDVNTEVGISDSIKIEGDVSGTTQVKLNNISKNLGLGQAITLIKVKKNSKADHYFLGQESIMVGAFNYDIDYEPGRYFLSPTLNHIGANYSSSSMILSGFNKLPTFYQRVGDKRYTQNGNQGWVRVHQDQTKLTQNHEMSIKRTVHGLQSGFDRIFMEKKWGKLVTGLFGQFSQIQGHTTKNENTSKIQSTGYGFGATATWEKYTGSYVDIQGQINWIVGNYSASPGGELATSMPFLAKAISLEYGRNIMTKNEKQSFIPQFQFTLGSINGGYPFTDILNNIVNLNKSVTLIGRFGARWEYHQSNRLYYATGNILHNFFENRNIEVAGAKLNTIPGKESGTWFDLGLGGEKTLGRKIVLFLEAICSQEIDANMGGNDELSINFSTGVRFRF